MNIEKSLPQKLNEIFQVKINEANLTKIIKHIYLKVNEFQQKIEGIDGHVKDHLFSQFFEQRVKFMINRQTESKFTALADKISNRESSLDQLKALMMINHNNQAKEIQKIREDLEQESLKVMQMTNILETLQKQNKMFSEGIQLRINALQYTKNNEKFDEKFDEKFESFTKDLSQKLQSYKKIHEETLKQQIDKLNTKINRYADQIYLRVSSGGYMDIKGRSLHPKDSQENRSKRKRLTMNCTTQIFNRSMQSRGSQGQNNGGIFANIHLVGEYKQLKQKVEALENSLYLMEQNGKSSSPGRQRSNSRKHTALDSQSGQKPQKYSRFRSSILNSSNKDTQQEMTLEQIYNRLGEQCYNIDEISDKIKRLQIKNEINDENYNRILMKLQKFSNLESKIQCKFQEVQKLRVELNTINEINSKFKKITSLMEFQEQKYVQQSTFKKNIQEINQNLREQTTSILKMAKKQQIKQAIEFLQNKIKEIIIIMSKTYENEKFGAINKIQNMKCLTCNKGFQQPFKNKEIKQSIRNSKTAHGNRYYFDKVHKENMRRMRTEAHQSTTETF